MPRTSTGEPRRPRRLRDPLRFARGRMRYLAVAAVVAFIAAYALPLLNPLFPEHTISSCTIEERSTFRLRHGVSPAQPSDCGNFGGAKSVACTSDPEQEVPLVVARTYDLVVRGPHIPFIGKPTIMLATVSKTQKFDLSFPEHEQGNLSDELWEKIAEDTSPETYRAYDYEQPAYDRECDPYRVIMTSKGIQVVSLERAAQLLTPGPGMTPRDPLLPCEGIRCVGFP